MAAAASGGYAAEAWAMIMLTSNQCGFCRGQVVLLGRDPAYRPSVAVPLN